MQFIQFTVESKHRWFTSFIYLAYFYSRMCGILLSILFSDWYIWKMLEHRNALDITAKQQIIQLKDSR